MCGRELRWASELHAAAPGFDGRDEQHIQNSSFVCADVFGLFRVRASFEINSCSRSVFEVFAPDFVQHMGSGMTIYLGGRQYRRTTIS